MLLVMASLALLQSRRWSMRIQIEHIHVSGNQGQTEGLFRQYRLQLGRGWLLRVMAVYMNSHIILASKQRRMAGHWDIRSGDRCRSRCYRSGLLLQRDGWRNCSAANDEVLTASTGGRAICVSGFGSQWTLAAFVVRISREPQRNAIFMWIVAPVSH